MIDLKKGEYVVNGWIGEGILYCITNISRLFQWNGIRWTEL